MGPKGWSPFPDGQWCTVGVFQGTEHSGGDGRAGFDWEAIWNLPEFVRPPPSVFNYRGDKAAAAPRIVPDFEESVAAQRKQR